MSGVTSTWSPDNVKIARTAIEGAPTLTDGYRVAATALGITPTAVRIARERGTLGKIGPKVVALKAPPSIPGEIALLKAKDQNASLAASNKALLAEVARKDAELSIYKATSRDPRPIKAPRTAGQDPKQLKGAAVLLCSDWHVEEPVYLDQVNGLNEYNLDIADACIKRLGEGFAWHVNDRRFDVRTAIIALLGDLMSGYIHEELVESNLLSPQDTVTWLTDRIEAMLRQIAADCPTLERFVIPCTSGNHGRATPKQKVSTRESNSNEQIVYQNLRRAMRDDPRFEFSIATGQWVQVDCMGHQLAFTHGDSFKYGGGVGGITIPIRKGISREFQGRAIHQFNMGHFHKRVDDGDIQVNGSMIGYGSYSQYVHAKPEPRQQAFYLVHETHGKCLAAPVWLDPGKSSRRGALGATAKAAA